ncbi:MAG: homoserine dehydrogenase, partial [Actinobacteria bacterium HGW-Actinobacteria-10]
MMRTINVGLIGLGTVGSGVVEIFGKHREDFIRRAQVDIRLSRFADRSKERFSALGLPLDRCHTDWRAVVEDPEIDVVIELIGGTGVAREVVFASLDAGKSVVTANKA